MKPCKEIKLEESSKSNRVWFKIDRWLFWGSLIWNGVPEAPYFIVAGFTPNSSRRRLWDDGVDGAAGAGTESVCRLFLLWDRHRRLPHHSPGDINP